MLPVSASETSVSDQRVNVGKWRFADQTPPKLERALGRDQGPSPGSPSPSARRSASSPAGAFVSQGYVHPSGLPASFDLRGEANFLMAKAEFDWIVGDWAAVEADGSRALAIDPNRSFNRRWDPGSLRAEALAHLGRRAEAEAAIVATPLDCYICVRVRGRIAALEGDRAAADRWFGEALRQAPDLPFAETEWGDALMARGQFQEAAAKYASAHSKNPRYADALKGWGDALSRVARSRDALAKYDEALELTPPLA